MAHTRKMLSTVVAMIVILATGCGQEIAGASSPTSPVETTVSTPQPNVASLSDDRPVEMFDRLVIPTPKKWSQGMNDEETAFNFIDGTACVDANAECPHVYFINLNSKDRDRYFDKNRWMQHPCGVTGSVQEVEGPVKMTLDGVTAQFFRHRCGPENEFTTYAWEVPSKQLFVYTINDKGGLSLETVQAVLEHLKWVKPAK